MHSALWLELRRFESIVINRVFAPLTQMLYLS